MKNQSRAVLKSVKVGNYQYIKGGEVSQNVFEKMRF